MSHKIYYFSGTGNTLYVAKEFAKAFPDAELISIASLDCSEDVEFDSDLAGIFFPVYCFGIPNILDRFLKRVKFMEDQTGKSVYAVCTSGGYPGAALPIVEDTLQEKNIDLCSCFHIPMVSGYFPFGESSRSSRTEQDHESAQRAIRVAVVMVKKRKRTRPLRIFPIDTVIKFAARKAACALPESDKAFRVDPDRCTACGQCYRICPASNIRPDEKDLPVWNHHCEQCMACLQWCPEGAILYKNVSRTRYHHPKIRPEELYRIRKEVQE